jgi:uncharacterized protein
MRIASCSAPHTTRGLWPTLPSHRQTRLPSLPADLTWQALLLIALAVSVGYLSFGATGFGASIISVPTAAHVLPLTFVVPMITTIDCIASINALTRQWRFVAWREVRHLLAPMLIGIAIGLTLLVNLPRNVALLALGIFVSLYAVYTLSGVRQWREIPPLWAIPFGLVGGVFSALFGTGGPIYMVFLSSRITDKAALRATSTVMVGLSVVIRAVLFAATGMLLQQGLLLMVALMVPLMLIGYAIGSRVHTRISSAAVRTWISWLLLANGLLLIVRSI